MRRKLANVRNRTDVSTFDTEKSLLSNLWVTLDSEFYAPAESARIKETRRTRNDEQQKREWQTGQPTRISLTDPLGLVAEETLRAMFDSFRVGFNGMALRRGCRTESLR